MSSRKIAFRVQGNKTRGTYWYVLVAGNGDAVMKSTTTYNEKASAKRAAKRMVKALQGSQLVLEYPDASGSYVQEAQEVVVSAESGIQVQTMSSEEARAHPELSPYAS